eukprot:scaffold3917_cov377-Prasinococcus_capsulatus_cf.AAC.14
MGELDLDVQETRIVLRSPKYKLNLPLPSKVDCHHGTAHWDAKAQRLRITLPVLRDGDYFPGLLGICARECAKRRQLVRARKLSHPYLDTLMPVVVAQAAHLAGASTLSHRLRIE